MPAPVAVHSEIAELFLSILDSIEQEVVVIDSNGVILFVNQAWKQFGMANGMGMDWIGVNYFHAWSNRGMVGSPDIDDIVEGSTAVISGRRSAFSYEYACHSPTEHQWFVMTIVDLAGYANARFVITHTDISQRKLAEQKMDAALTKQRLQNATLRKLETRHRQLMQKLRVGIVVHDADSRIVFSNPRAAELLGLSEDQMQAKAAIDPAWCFLNEQGERFRVEDYPVSRVIATKMPLNETILGISSPTRETVVWVSVSAFPELDENGQLKEIVVNFHDITQRKQAENIIIESERQLKNILDTCPTAARITQCDGNKYSYYNAQYLRMTNNDAHSINGYEPCSYYDPHVFADILATLAKGENIVDRLVELRKPGDPDFGVKWQVASYFNIVYENQPATLAWFHDITEHIRLERMKSEFISTVSHELRTPLTSITGALGLLVNQVFGINGQQAQHLVEVAHRNSMRLAFLINDLLDMDKLVAGKMVFDMQDHFLIPIIRRSIEDNCSYQRERNVELVCDDYADLRNVQVRCDELRLLQILSNLLSNAIKFSPDHGQVMLACTLAPSRHITISITDQGSGIPAEFQRHLFQKFSQADSSDVRQKGGTGLGLAISRELIEQMGGTIDFTSVAGQGACFCLTLSVV